MAVTVRRASDQTAYVTFSLPGKQEPGPVSVVGSFNEWTPGAHEMHEDDDGTLSVTVEVPYGAEVHFRYLAEGGRWFDDSAAVADEEGGMIRAVVEGDDGAEDTAAPDDLAHTGFEYEGEPPAEAVIDLSSDPATSERR
jgi:1,4-alpha-glucan branching enzyme